MNAPKFITFFIAIILAGLGIAGQFVSIPLVSAHGLLFVAAGFILLALGNIFKGL